MLNRRPNIESKMKIAGIFPTREKISLEIDLTGEQPLGIAYVMAAAKKAGHDVTLSYGQPDLDEIIDSDVLALSLLTIHVPVGLDIARRYKLRNPGGKVVVGGPHVSGDPNIILDPYIDYGVIGEGEETFVELLDSLNSPESVKGIAYEKSGQAVRNEKRPRIEYLDSMRPIRDSSFIRNSDFSLAYPPTSERVGYPLISSRGCGKACEFCMSPLVWQKRVIYRNPTDVVTEFEELTQDRTKELFFFDEENLFSDPGMAKNLLRALAGKGYNLASCGDIRAIDEEMADLMQKAGYTQVFWGVESADPEVLAREKKGSSREKIHNALDLCAENGIVNIGMIMIGFDYETEQNIVKYAKELPDYNLHQLRLSIATPFPGTTFERRLRDQGVDFDPDLTHWDTGHLVYEHPTIDPERMQELQHHIVRNFYKSPQWDRRMHDFAVNHPRMRQSVDEFRSYVSGRL